MTLQQGIKNFSQTVYFENLDTHICFTFVLRYLVPSGRRQELAVIARVRYGNPCVLGPYSIAMVITEALHQYRSVLTIAFVPPNFVIGMTTTELQLQLLSFRTIEGPGFVLDMVPWSPEYQAFDLPWILTRIGRGTPHGSFPKYINSHILPSFVS